ncbi:hypothetical protein FQN54_003223 [Arachnomyces sp. PD_36]|nr:hypothetical protein FQN54_003223 [Arachnomyces sp. PD_36]
MAGPSSISRRRSRRLSGDLSQRSDGMEPIGLERSMSRRSREIREGEEGKAGGMSEMAVPSPVERRIGGEGTEEGADRVGLERSMTKEMRGVRDGEEGRAGSITEMAVPFPIRKGSTVSRRGGGEETEREDEVAMDMTVRRRGRAPSDTEARPIQQELPVEAKPSPWFATELYTLSYLIFFSIFGTLARIGLQTLTVYPGAPVTFGVIWANVGGCLIMGFLIQDRNLFLLEEWVPTKQKQGGDSPNNSSQNEGTEKESPEEAHNRQKSVKKSIPLYIGLATGFCGSFTSFSTFIRDVYFALSNNLPSTTASHTPRNGGYSFMAVLAVLLSTVSLSITALLFGAHLALALDSITPTLSFTLTRRYVDRVFVFLAWGCWLGAVFMAIWPPDRHGSTSTTTTQRDTWRGRALFAIIFAPFGCILRYYLSIYLNSRLPSFPLGTFAANILGTIVLGTCFDLQHVDGIAALAASTGTTESMKHMLLSCQVLQGVMDGFCGCLTTVSTWVAELNGFENRWHGYFYGVVSVLVGLGALVVIIGPLEWTVGLQVPVCVSS